MELRQLEHFVAVAEEGYFNRAASRCHIVRSGLSASIRGLEKELGTRLFIRTTRDVRLTAAGRALLGEARRTLAAAEAAREAVSGVEGLLRGGLTLGVAEPNRAVDPPALLARFHTAHPGVTISLVREAWTDVVERVRAGAVDVGLAYLPAQLPADVVAEPLASGPMVVACAYGHPLASQSAVALDELRHETLITLPSTWGARTSVEEALEAAGGWRTSGVEATGLESFLDLVRVGLGVAIVPGPDAGGAVAEMVRRADAPEPGTSGRRPVCYVPIEGRPPVWTYGCVASPPELRTAATRAFLATLGQDQPEPP